MSERFRRRLGGTLTALFVLSLILGPGPGVLLVNPSEDPAEPAARVLAIPIVYAWAILWFAVQLTIILLANALIWRAEDPDDAESES